MTMKCRIEAGFPDEKSLQAALAALSHEGNAGGRSSAKLSGRGRMLAIEIEAQDVVALRAAANAYLRALQVFEGIEKAD